MAKVWVKVHEKFHGKDTGSFWKTYPSAAVAKKEATMWNRWTSRDQLKVLKVSSTKPLGLKVTSTKGIYKETKATKVPAIHRQAAPRTHKVGGMFSFLREEVSKWK